MISVNTMIGTVLETSSLLAPARLFFLSSAFLMISFYMGGQCGQAFLRVPAYRESLRGRMLRQLLQGAYSAGCLTICCYLTLVFVLLPSSTVEAEIVRS